MYLYGDFNIHQSLPHDIMKMSYLDDPQQQHGRTGDNATTAAAAATALSKHPTPAPRKERETEGVRHVCDIITVRHNKGERDREAFFLYDGNTIQAGQSLQGKHFFSK